MCVHRRQDLTDRAARNQEGKDRSTLIESALRNHLREMCGPECTGEADRKLAGRSLQEGRPPCVHVMHIGPDVTSLDLCHVRRGGGSGICIAGPL